jgi:hypothetical protein
MQVSVHILTKVLGLDISRSRHLTDVIDTLVSFLSYLDILDRLRLYLLVNESYGLKQRVEFTDRHRVYLMLSHILDDSDRLNR